MADMIWGLTSTELIGQGFLLILGRNQKITSLAEDIDNFTDQSLQ